jgi:hypothetical protein
MCRLVYTLSSQQATMAIIDLPEFSALQRYYLQLVNVPATLCDLQTAVATIQPGDLFLATWSLSETPITFRAPVLDYALRFNAILIAFQRVFSGIDNLSFFTTWVHSARGFSWRLEHIDHLPGNYYLFGKHTL